MAVKTNFNMVTTIEELEMKIESSGAVLKYGDYVLVCDCTVYGYTAAVYEFLEEEGNGISMIECEISIVKIADEYFKENGAAIAWALNEVNTQATEKN